MKAPIGVFGCRWGFSVSKRRWQQSRLDPTSRLQGGGTNQVPWEFSPDEGFAMPIWIEILLNVIGYGGFVAIATMNPCADKAAARQARGPNAVN
jgi:hypothetical protein